MTRRTRHSMGGGTPAHNISLGASAAIRPGRSPGMDSSEGATLSIRRGRSPGQDVSKGASLAMRRMNKGGYLGTGDPAGMERLKLSRERNDKLGVPHYAQGGYAHKGLEDGLRSVYKMLHSHFGGGSEPEIEKKKSGGKLWIQNTVKNKGTLHRSLHVPEGKKIPVSELHRAEHSKSPTLRGFHRKPQGR